MAVIEAAAFEAKVQALERCLRGLGRVAVAFSGGVDSSVLLAAAREALGDGAVGVIADSPSLARRELEAARSTARAIGAELAVVRTGELEDPSYRANAGDRCYFCKAALFRALERWARERGIAHLAFGEIVDDLREVRPGARAAQEFGVHAPLRECGFTKEDVRRFARSRGLPVAEKPAAPCLASRLPVGTEVTRARLARVERAEDALAALGFRVLRVRDRGDLARVELGGDELARGRELEREIARALERAGFARAELGVYRSPAAPAS